MFVHIGDVGYITLVLGFVGLIISSGNLLIFVLFCEIVWISFYYVLIFAGAIYDSLLIVIYGIYLLCVATSETGIGLNLLLLKFKTDGNLKYLNIQKSRQGKKNKNYRGFWGKLS